MKSKLIMASAFFTLFMNVHGYDACKDKNIEFCLEDGKPPVFDYAPPKKAPEVVKKAEPKKEKKVVLDTSTGFKKGEIVKEVEMLGASNSAINETVSGDGFNPDKDYFIEDKSGKEEILVGGEKIKVRRITRSLNKEPSMKPTGVITGGGQTAPKMVVGAASSAPQVSTVSSVKNSVPLPLKKEPISLNNTPASQSPTTNHISTGQNPNPVVESARVFTVGEDGKIVTQAAQVTTQNNQVKIVVTNKTPAAQTPKAPSNQVTPKVSVWGNLKDRYQTFKTTVVLPKIEQAKTRIKNLLGRFFK